MSKTLKHCAGTEIADFSTGGLREKSRMWFRLGCQGLPRGCPGGGFEQFPNPDFLARPPFEKSAFSVPAQCFSVFITFRTPISLLGPPGVTDDGRMAGFPRESSNSLAIRDPMGAQRRIRRLKSVENPEALCRNRDRGFFGRRPSRTSGRRGAGAGGVA